MLRDTDHPGIGCLKFFQIHVQVRLSKNVCMTNISFLLRLISIVWRESFVKDLKIVYDFGICVCMWSFSLFQTPREKSDPSFHALVHASFAILSTAEATSRTRVRDTSLTVGFTSWDSLAASRRIASTPSMPRT